MGMISRAEHRQRMGLYSYGLKQCSGCAEALPLEWLTRSAPVEWVCGAGASRAPTPRLSTTRSETRTSKPLVRDAGGTRTGMPGRRSRVGGIHAAMDWSHDTGRRR